MKFETLKKSKKKKYVIGIIVLIAVISTISLVGTRAKYRMTQSIKIAEGTIKNYSPADLNIFAIKVQNGGGGYDNSNTVPESGYTLNTTESYCTIPDGNGNNVKDSSITINYHDGVVGIDNMTKKGTKCYLYFDENKIVTSEIILANTPLASGTPNFSNTSCSNGCGEKTNGLYQSVDDDGITYYFRGNVSDNWVAFAGFYWRIVRINGDGTIRLIYSGTSPTATGDNAQIGKYAFNPNAEDNMYVGYMYTNGSVHGLTNSSTAKSILDEWFVNNLDSYKNKIDTNAGFCGDRSAYTNSYGTLLGGGTGTINTYYGAYIRLVTNKTPSFKCLNNEDLYTLSSSSKGNKALTYPIGMITADEVVYAGGVAESSNPGYYLCTGSNFWTMTPYSFISSDTYKTAVFMLASGSILGNGMYFGTVTMAGNGVRPVINLKANVNLTGRGTSTDPYVVS